MLRNREGMAHVEHCVEKMAGHLLAVEFRNKSWFDGVNEQKTLDFERRLNVVHTIVDGPQGFANCVPCIWEVTSPQLAIVRLHGRNGDTWNRTGLAASSSRFDYWYSKDELAALVPEMKAIADKADKVQALFNTNMADQGEVNARLLAGLLAASHRPAPVNAG